MQNTAKKDEILENNIYKLNLTNANPKNEVIFVTHNKGKIASAKKQLKFVNFALHTIGIKGILKLMEGKENRKCRFTECLSYYDGEELHQFMGKHEGTLSKEILGNDTDKKWSDLWYIFKPYGYSKTFAQMTDEERANRIKYESIDSMQEFAKWYRNKLN